MKKITFYLFTLFISSSMLINAQTQITQTLDVDITGAQTWDAFQDASNEVLTIALDGFSGITGCDNPVLEVTGAGFETNQTTVGGSYLSEMRMAITDTGITAGVFLTPGNADAMAGTGTYSSGGIEDYDAAMLTFTIANATTGDMRLEFNESFDDVADAVDGTFTGPSTLTIQYRLSCSNTLSVEEVEVNNAISHFYNTNSNDLTLKSSSLVFTNVEVYSILGQRVLNKKLSQTTETVNLSNLTDGIYIAKVSIDGKTETIKFVKK